MVGGTRAARVVVAAVSAAFVAAAGSAAAPRGELAQPTLHGSVWTGKRAALQRLDPATLRPVKRTRATLRQLPMDAAYSPDGRRLAVDTGVDGLVVLRASDLAVVRRITGYGGVRLVAWPRAGRILLVASYVALLDPTRRQPEVRSWGLDGGVVAAAATGHGVVLLLAPDEKIGPLRLVRVDAAGAFGSVAIPRVTGGTAAPEPGGEVATRQPALAVGAAGRTAYVLAAGSPVAEVDLPSLAVRYHEVRALAARTKLVAGSARAAVVVGDTLAVSGVTYSRGTQNGTAVVKATPAGLTLVDTRDWSVRRVDDAPTSVARAGSTLLAFGGGYDGVRQTGSGLRAYDARGAERWHLFGSEPVGGVQHLGARLYVGGPGARVLRIVDLERGAVVGTARFPGPTMLFLPR